MKDKPSINSENKSPSSINESSQKEMSTPSTAQFIDNRPQAIAQRKLQEKGNNHPRMLQLKAIQEMADKNAAKQQPIQRNENQTGLPDNLKSGIENLSGYSMSDVNVHYNSNKPAQLNAHAYAQGTDIHLGYGQEKHLPHEAWHVVQQKQGRVKPTLKMKENENVNDDSSLEKEAQPKMQKIIGNKTKLTPPFQLNTNSNHSINNTIQKKVTVNGNVIDEGSEPNKDWGFTEDQVTFYKYLIKDADPHLLFKSEEELKSYVTHYAKFFTKQQSAYENMASGKNIQKIKEAEVSSFDADYSEVKAEIVITTDDNEKIKIRPFASKKRHLMDSFAEDRNKPPAAKDKNSLVGKKKDFEESFKDYSKAIAKDIANRNMLIGYEPIKFDHKGSSIKYANDQKELPNESYDRENAIHSFPDAEDGGVYSPSQKQYALLFPIFAYLYDTDVLQPKKPDPSKPKKRKEELLGWGNTDKSKLENAIQNTKEILNHIEELKKLGWNEKSSVADNLIVLNSKDNKEAWKQFRDTKLSKLSLNIYEKLITYGGISEVDSGTDLKSTHYVAFEAYQKLESEGQTFINDFLSATSKQPKNDLKNLKGEKPKKQKTDKDYYTKMQIAKKLQKEKYTITRADKNDKQILSKLKIGWDALLKSKINLDKDF